MALTAEEVVVKLKAELADYDRKITNSTRLTDQAFNKIADSQARTEAQIKRSAAAISSTFKGMAGSLATYFSGRELVGIIDSFTQFQNKLRVAGVAAADMDAVQERLFASAQKYGVELGALGGLYSSLASASKELGASQEQVFELTDAVSAALKVSGTSAEAAGGALLQLGQALRGGKVQAEEFNSLIDGLYPLLEAAAGGSSRFGGSVANLTKLVKDGKVASSELFSAILNGSEMLERKAASSAMTLSGAYTQLTNALTVYVGQAAQSSGAQAALTQGITTLANNLDSLIPALALLGAALGVKYVAGAGAAALATLKVDAALLGLTSRAEVAGFAMGRLVRSLSINTAVLALTAAIGGFGTETATATSLVQQANTAYDEMRKRLEATAGVASSAGDGARAVGEGAAGAEPKVRSFAGAVGELANQLHRQAQAAKAARVEMLEKRLADSQASEVEIGKRTPAGRNASVGEFRRGDVLNNLGVLQRAVVGSVRSLLSGGRTDREATEAYRKQSAVSTELMDQLRRAKAAPLADFVGTPTSGAVTPGAGKGKGSGKSVDQIREQRERAEQEVTNAQIAYLQELAQTTQNASESAELEQKVIAATRLANEQDIKNNEALNEAQRAKLLEINEQVAALRAQQLKDQEAERLRQQQLNITTAALRDQDSLLQLQSGLAETAKDRREIELRRLDIAYRLEEAAITEELTQAQIAGDTQRIAAARKRLADLEERRATDSEGVKRANATPAERYLRSVNRSAAAIGEDIQTITANGLDKLNDDLAEAITGAKSLGDAFSNVADQIVNDLLRIAIQQTLIKPLANSLFGGGGGGLFGGILSGIGSVFGGFRASGGPVSAGKSYIVGERGPELLKMGGSPGTIVPNHAMRRSGSASIVQPVINVDARGAVMNDQFARMILSQAHQGAVQVASAMGQGVLKGMPARLAQYQMDGT